MRYIPEFNLYNASHEAIRIYSEEISGYEKFESVMSEFGGHLVIADEELADSLGTEAMLESDARFLAEKARESGKHVFSIDACETNEGLKISLSLANNGRNSFLVVDREDYVIMNKEEALEYFSGLLRKVENVLKGEVFFIKNTELDSTFGPFFSQHDAEKAARNLFPEYCFRDEDFEIAYRLKKSA